MQQEMHVHLSPLSIVEQFALMNLHVYSSITRLFSLGCLSAKHAGSPSFTSTLRKDIEKRKVEMPL